MIIIVITASYTITLTAVITMIQVSTFPLDYAKSAT